jgi:general secretion pathway protein G
MAFFYPSSFSSLKKDRGFTLIELIVVVTIIAVLFVGLAIVFNPLSQLNKSQNTVRQHDLEEIKSSLDMYYDDTGCYPTSITFFRQFVSNDKVYMSTVPEDPKCQSNGQNCYIYQTDTTSSCPQWNVLYAKLAPPVSENATCPLSAISSTCVPTNYTALGLNYCVPSGKLDCSKIASDVTPLAPPGGMNFPTPTQGMCQAYYACTGNKGNACNTLDQNAQQNCRANGGVMTCYCDSLCSNQCQ